MNVKNTSSLSLKSLSQNKDNQKSFDLDYIKTETRANDLDIKKIYIHFSKAEIYTNDGKILETTIHNQGNLAKFENGVLSIKNPLKLKF